MANGSVYKSDLKKLLMNDTNVTPIKSVRFSIMSDEEKVKRSAYELTSSEIYHNGAPVKGGLADIRGGSTEAFQQCGTCRCDPSVCPGHFAHLNLATPVFAPARYLEVLKKLLDCVCWNCHRLLLEQKQWPPASFVNSKRFNYVVKKFASKTQQHATCPHCKFEKPKIVRGKDNAHLVVTHSSKNVDENEPTLIWVPPIAILNILKGIPNADAAAIGFDRKLNGPESLIWNVLVVPPQTIRPAVKYGVGGNRGEDDITFVLRHIFAANKAVADIIAKDLTGAIPNATTLFTGGPQKAVAIDSATFDSKFKSAFGELQKTIAALIDNEHGIQPLTHRSSKAYKTITSRFKGKSGRIRANLLGKRVNHSARTVASADPYLSISEVGIPYKIAMNLTIPETVTAWNISRLRDCVRNGPHVHPGAIYIKKKGGVTRYGIIKDAHLDLGVGDVVYRHLTNGDPVIVNRQPTLHRLSMMCHQVRVLPQNTLRLSVLNMPGYAGDFDGDEFNIHCHQSVQTATEISMLSMPHLQLLRPRNAEPCIAILQDLPIAIYQLARDDRSIDMKDLANIACRFKGRSYNMLHDILTNGGKNALPKMVPVKTIFKVLFPEGLKVTSGKVTIENGEVSAHGPFDAKKLFNHSSTGVVHTIISEWGSTEARWVLDNTQRLAIEYLMLTGASVGIKDLLLNEQDTEKVSITRQNIMETARKVIKESRTREFRSDLGDNANYLMKLERAISEVTNVDSVEEIVKAIDSKHNRFLQLVESGSKGSTANLAHMFGIIGQQMPGGNRVKAEFDGRTTPHFTKFDLGLEAKGFVKNSYLSGLEPTEFFFAAIKGREGLLDTAVSTSDCGYANRKLVKAMEDLHVSQELMVVDASNNIVQFVYGEDGIDINKSEIMDLSNFMTADDAAFEKQYLWSAEFMKVTGSGPMKRGSDKAALNKYHAVRNEIATHTYHGKFPKEFLLHMAINIDKMLQHTADGSGSSELDSEDVYNIVSGYVKTHLYITKLKGDETTDTLFRTSLQRVVVMKLSPYKIIVEKKWSEKQLKDFLGSVAQRYYAAIVHPGEMVGILSAQSVGDRLTQSTLDTFKAVRAADTVLTLSGLPRIKEIMSFTKTIKVPSMRFRLKDVATADTTKRKIELIKLKDLLKKYRVVHCTPTKLLASEGLEGDDVERFYRRMERHTPAAIATYNSRPGWFMVLTINHRHVTTDALTVRNIEEKLSEKIAVKHRIFSQVASKVHGNGARIGDSSNVKMILEFSLLDAINSESEVVHSSLRTSNHDVNKHDVVADITNLKDVILDKPLLGFQKITKVQKIAPKNDKRYEREKVYEVGSDGVMRVTEKDIVTFITEGSDLRSIMALGDVDSNSVTSNDFHDVLKTLGIEAAKYTILNEVNATFANENGKHVADRHILLMADFATSTGAFTSFERSGFAKSDLTGPLAKASFERQATMLLNAAIFGEVDNLTGVSANLIFGQIGNGGTAISKLLMDHEKLRHTAIIADERMLDDGIEPEVVQETPSDILRRLKGLFKGFDMLVSVDHIVPFESV